MFEGFTDRGRRVLVLAQEEARLLNHSAIGTEHLLLGLIHEGEGVAAKALESLGISLEPVRKKVEETIGMVGSAPTGSPPFTPEAKKILERSRREALELGHRGIGTEHILLGLVRDGEGVACQVLVSLGADPGRVRHEVLDTLTKRRGTGTADDVAPTGHRSGYWHENRQVAVPRLRRRFLAVPPLLVLVSAGLVGLAAGWVASRRSLQTLTRHLEDVEARLDQLLDANRVRGSRRPGARPSPRR